MERENAIFLAKLADKAVRFPDMVESIKKVCEINPDLTPEERNLVSAAYKNSVAPCRTGWRVILASELREEQKGDTELLKVIKGYRQKVEAEQESICRDAIDLVDNVLLPESHSAEARVFYLKMKGDYYRYLAEVKVRDERTNIADKAREAYEDAKVAASEDLAATHPIRLSLALNFSVFYYEIIQNTEKACELAKGAIHEACSNLDSLTEETYKDSNLVMQLLRDNITLWSDKLQPNDQETSSGEEEFVKLEHHTISASLDREEIKKV